MPKRHISIALLIYTSFVAPNVFAFCENFPNPTQEYQRSELVFIGTVLKKDKIPEAGNFIVGTRYLVHVKEILKGKPKQRFSLYSENTSSRFPMEIGQNYLVFTSLGVFEELQEKQPFIDSCGNSGLLNKSGKAISIVRKLSATE
ncbi:MAG: hypothetical protein HY306_06495 [Nitrosomonadales bacterium]|nr:hypothetical protein [Nitrosomonadales bacterium]